MTVHPLNESQVLNRAGSGVGGGGSMASTGGGGSGGPGAPNSSATSQSSTMADLLTLIENDIPEGRHNLQESHSNLEKVADYCESNYFQSDNKKAALETTKGYTTQSLASVAYQINTLAYNLLHMLDLQTTQLAEMESSINHITETVAIHKEKVARREIGILTTNKTAQRQHKILVPVNPERSVKYIRKPIDYGILDDIGHGIKITTNAPRNVKRTSSTSSSHAMTMNGSMTLSHGSSVGLVGPAPTSKPPTPPSARNVGSLSRGSKEYRTPAPPIAPPQVPSNYAPNYPIGHPRAQDSSRRGSGYSTLPMGGSGQHHVQQAMQQMAQQQGLYGVHQAPQVPGQQVPPNSQQQGMSQVVGKVHPYPHQQTGPGQQPPTSMAQNFVAPSPTPPPPPPMPSGQSDVPQSPISDSLPEPPQHLRNSTGDHYMERQAVNASPPLPPPPPMDDGSVHSNQNHYHQQQQQQQQQHIGYGHMHTRTGGGMEPDWVPKNYLEKVIAIYDYGANRDDELSFQENSVIYVIKKNDDGWYEGVMDGITGLFPGNYVEPCL